MTKQPIPMLDLQAQYAPIKEAIYAAFDDVFENKQFINGPKVEELERNIAQYCGTADAIGVSSGTDAILAALFAHGISSGDEVITTPFTFFATVGCIHRSGATPVFVDINPDTFLMDISQIESKITSKTKAIIPVHLFGQMVDMDAINKIAKKHQLIVIEDAAQAIGSEYVNSDKKTVRAGAAGDIGCFSFYPSKNLGACGDGGIITTNDSKMGAYLRKVRNHGETQRYHHELVGGNFRLDGLQAAFLLVKFPFLEEQHKKRQENAAFYDKALHSYVKTPKVLKGNRMIYNQYTIRTPKRDALHQYLQDQHIGNAIYYPVPLHLQECFHYLGYQEGDFPVAELAAKEVLSIPVYAELTEEQRERIASTIASFFS